MRIARLKTAVGADAACTGKLRRESALRPTLYIQGEALEVAEVVCSSSGERPTTTPCRSRKRRYIATVLTVPGIRGMLKFFPSTSTSAQFVSNLKSSELPSEESSKS